MPRAPATPCENEDGVKRGRQERHGLVALGHPPSHKKLDICLMSSAGRGGCWFR